MQCASPEPTRKFSAGRSSERGTALLFVIYLMVALSIFIVAAISYMGNSIHRSRKELAYHGQATNVARAGLSEAVAWFKSQATQPVRSSGNGLPYPDAAFNPLHTDVAKTDWTDDQNTGLVKEYPISDDGLLAGRFVIRKQAVDNAANPAQNDSSAAHDISSQLGKGNPGDGLAWYIEAKGYVYRKTNADNSFLDPSSIVVDSIRMAEQILALGLRRPAESAIIVGNAANINIGSNARITGMPNSYAVTYKSGTGTPSPSSAPASVTGSPSAYKSLASASYFDDVIGVFGVTQADVKSLASISVSSVAGLPTDMPSMAIVYIDGNAVFTPTRPLAGGGVLFVNGDLTIQTNSNSLYSGFIYVTGRVYQYAPSLVSGMVIAHNGYTISGANDVAQVEYSASVLSTVRNQLCQYQEAKSAYVVH